MPEESKLAKKLENQSKFTEEEIKKVKDIQQEYLKIQAQFGQFNIAKIRVMKQLKSLDDTEATLHGDFEKLQEDESKFLDETTKKYGEGTLNPETGEFTPNK